MPHDVIMPALGMAQDTGLIIAWHKAPGDAVAAGDVLFEVETDKSAMEVEAGHDGFVAALLAEAGEEAPVGEVIAVISAEKPEEPIQTSISTKAASEPAAATASPPAAAPDEAAEATSVTAPAKKASAVPVNSSGPILASPKAKRLAAEQGLDLGHLATTGIQQPYHVADLETLRALPPITDAINDGSSDAHITARVNQMGFVDFHNWLDGHATAEAVLAAFAGASLRRATGSEAVIVRIDQPVLSRTSLYADPDIGPISSVRPVEENGTPALILRDLTASRITGGSFGSAEAPVLTIATEGDDFALSLDFAHDQLGTEAAISVLDGFAMRLEEPLRQLL